MSKRCARRSHWALRGWRGLARLAMLVALVGPDANAQSLVISPTDAEGAYDANAVTLTTPTTTPTPTPTPEPSPATTAPLLTVSTSGTGTGRVVSEPVGIDCGADCEQSYEAGTGVILVAEPAARSIFAGWSGSCSGFYAACYVTMAEARHAIATFDLGPQIPVGEGPVTAVFNTDAGPLRVIFRGVTRPGRVTFWVNMGVPTAPTSEGWRYVPLGLHTLRAWDDLAFASADVCLPLDLEALSANGLVPEVVQLMGVDFTDYRFKPRPSWVDESGSAVCATVTTLIDFNVGAPTVLRRYLAEGATGGFWSLRLALLNPTAKDTTAALRYLLRDGTTIPATVALPAHTRVTVEPALDPAMARAEFSTVVESDTYLVVDRTMQWDGSRGYGSHAETSVAEPALTWYLAEGATHSGFDLYYLLQNANDQPARVDVTYLRAGGLEPIQRSYTVAAHSRENILVNEIAGLGSAEVSAVLRVTNGQPIIVERAMYQTKDGVFWAAGHDSVGITQPAPSWFLAEGATGTFFDTYLLLANPQAVSVTVDITYLLEDGTTRTRTHVLPPSSRTTIFVDEDGTDHRDVGVSMVVNARDHLGIIAERAMWWPGPTFHSWTEAHNAAGTTTTGVGWALAEGQTGGTRAEQTYVLIANTSGFEGAARVTIYCEGGGSTSLDIGLLARSRRTLDMTDPAAKACAPDPDNRRRFGVVVESLNATPARIVVERAMYSSDNGAPWFLPYWPAGTDAIATRLR